MLEAFIAGDRGIQEKSRVKAGIAEATPAGSDTSVGEVTATSTLERAVSELRVRFGGSVLCIGEVGLRSKRMTVCRCCPLWHAVARNRKAPMRPPAHKSRVG